MCIFSLQNPLWHTQSSAAAKDDRFKYILKAVLLHMRIFWVWTKGEGTLRTYFRTLTFCLQSLLEFLPDLEVWEVFWPPSCFRSAQSNPSVFLKHGNTSRTGEMSWKQWQRQTSYRTVTGTVTSLLNNIKLYTFGVCTFFFNMNIKALIWKLFWCWISKYSLDLKSGTHSGKQIRSFANRKENKLFSVQRTNIAMAPHSCSCVLSHFKIRYYSSSGVKFCGIIMPASLVFKDQAFLMTFVATSPFPDRSMSLQKGETPRKSFHKRRKRFYWEYMISVCISDVLSRAT